VFTDAIQGFTGILENTYFEVFAKKKPVCPNLHQQKQETSNSTTIN
jgi:hypothetical protein